MFIIFRCFHNNFTWNTVEELCEFDPKVALVLFSKDTINYWPFNNNTLDYAGQANLTEGPVTGILNSTNTFFDRDRSGRVNSALNLNNWFKRISPGVYFQGDFSVSFWIKFQADNISPSGAPIGLLDFGSDVVLGCMKDNCLLELVINSVTSVKSVKATTQLKNGFWTFVVVTFEVKFKPKPLGSIYLDGTLVGQNILDLLIYVVRTNNLIGAKASGTGSPYGWSLSLIDELRIFNRSLTQTEIILLMNLN